MTEPAEMDDFTNASAMDAGSKFFAIDRRAWAAVCGLRDINCAVSYLVMASGTQKNHRTTSWSTNSIETHTGVARHLAKAAIERLISAGLVTRTQGGSKPRYYLVAAHEVPGCEGFARPDPEGQYERDLLVRLRALKPGRCFNLPKNNRERFWADRLVEAGLAAQDGNDFTAVPYDAEAAARPDWIWMPTSLIVGAAGEEPPVELLRQSHNLPAMRLFVDLYHAQSLARYGGVHWRQLRRCYTSQRMGEHGAHVVWGFVRTNTLAPKVYPLVRPHLNGKPSTRYEGHDHGWEVFYDALDLLTETLGLAEFISHVVEADDDAASVLFPCAVGNGEPEERAIGDAAHAAGLRMILDGRVRLAHATDMRLVPIRKHFAAPAMVGLLRLRYQPRTEVTLEWLGRKPKWAALATEFDELARDSLMQHQVEI